MAYGRRFTEEILTNSHVVKYNALRQKVVTVHCGKRRRNDPCRRGDTTSTTYLKSLFRQALFRPAECLLATFIPPSEASRLVRCDNSRIRGL